jgi:hypothetical protein
MSKQARLTVADGIWYQYGGPQVVSGGGKTLWAWVDAKGNIRAASYDHSTREVTENTIAPDFHADDRSQPSLLIRSSDNRVIIFHTKHADNTLRWRISDDACDVASFGPELTYTLAGGGVALAYPQPVELTAEGRIYVFFRRTTRALDEREWRYVISADDGATFGSESVLRENFQSCGGKYVINPYTMPVSNGPSRIDFVSSDYEQIERGGTPRNVYHWYYQGGAYYRSDGTWIKDLQDGHIQSQAEVTTVDETDDTNIWDITLDGNGYPVVVYVKFLDYHTDHRYRYARWNGSEWNHYEIVSGGGPVSEASGREWYSGGICLNRNNPSIVYLSRETRPQEFEIHEYFTPDGGATWRLVAKYEGRSNTKNFRPQYPRNADEDQIQLMFVSGDYADSSDYSASILSYPGPPRRLLHSLVKTIAPRCRKMRSLLVRS